MQVTECDISLSQSIEPHEWPDCLHDDHWSTVNWDERPGGWLDWNDAPAECRYAQKGTPCELPKGHPMPHRFEVLEGVTFWSARDRW